MRMTGIGADYCHCACVCVYAFVMIYKVICKLLKKGFKHR